MNGICNRYCAVWPECDCGRPDPFPGRTDADGRRFGPLDSLAEVTEQVRQWLQERGYKPEAAAAAAPTLAAKIFTREIGK